MFRYIRIVLATVVLLLSLAFFLDFSGALPDRLHGLMHLQFVPAFMSGMWAIVVLLLLSVLIFGRVYCSVICPFGILQDVVSRVKKAWMKIRKKKPNYRVKYSAPNNWLRYGFFAATVVPMFFGVTVVVTLLDPYSNFGRMATALFKPVFVWGNNLLAAVMNAAGNYSVYNVSYHVTGVLLVGAAVVFAVLVVMVWRKDRIWCNTVCPVGTLFGFLSRYSLFGMRLDKATCGHCNKCTQFCKSRCIDHENLRIDTSRCVVCYNCVGKCTKDSISYGFRYGGGCKSAVGDKVVADVEVTDVADATVDSAHNMEYDASRRRFLQGLSASLVIAPVAAVAAVVDGGAGVTRKRMFPMPPGAADNFGELCTGCQLCVTRCPMHVLRASFLERGWSGIMQPHMYFQPHSYCNYECTVCGDVCPNGAIRKLTVEDKKLQQVGVVVFVEGECVVKRDHKDCGACAEHCPTGGVAMVDYVDGLTIPRIDPAVCIGCGACESICPERGRAIYIDGLEIQVAALAPRVDEQEDVEVSGFGF